MKKAKDIEIVLAAKAVSMRKELAPYFPGSPCRSFELRLDDVPGYRHLDCRRVLDESIQLVRYSLDSVPRCMERNGVLVALSGGADSSTTAVVCSRAIKEYGKGRMLCITVGVDPENEMEQRDIESAKRVCAELDIEHRYVDASGIFKEWENAQHLSDSSVYFSSVARLRHIISRRQADMGRLLVAGTFTHSEFLLRAFTGGMMPANFSFISPLYKTEAIGLGKYAGVPEYVFAKEPGGSELMSTDKELYGIGFENGLDAVLWMFENGNSAEDISRTYGIDIKWLRRLRVHMTKQDWRVATVSLRREHVELRLS